LLPQYILSSRVLHVKHLVDCPLCTRGLTSLRPEPLDLRGLDPLLPSPISTEANLDALFVGDLLAGDLLAGDLLASETLGISFISFDALGSDSDSLDLVQGLIRVFLCLAMQEDYLPLQHSNEKKEQTCHFLEQSSTLRLSSPLK